MPKILEMKEIDGELWCRVGVPPDFESGVALWTPDEQRKNYQAGLKRAAEIVQDTGAKFQFGTAGKAVDWYIGVADVMNRVNDVLAEEINPHSANAQSSSGG